MAVFFALPFIGILSGCVEDGPPRPIPILPMPGSYNDGTPSWLIDAIVSADHIVVTNRLAGQPDAPGYAGFSVTITGNEMKRVIHAVSSLRTSVYELTGERSGTFYEWQLQFYRGTELLGAADLSDDLVFCERGDLAEGDPDGEFHEPWMLRRLYHRIVKESGEKNWAMLPHTSQEPTPAMP